MPGFWILLVGCDVLGVQRFPELASQSQCIRQINLNKIDLSLKKPLA